MGETNVKEKTDEDEDEDEDERLEAWRKKREARKRAREQQKEQTAAAATATGEDDLQLLATGSDAGDDDDDAVVITAAKRRKMEQEALLLSSTVPAAEGGSESQRAEQRAKQRLLKRRQEAMQDLRGEDDRNNLAEREESNQQEKEEEVEDEEPEEENSEKKVASLLEQAAALQQTKQQAQEDENVRRQEHEEARILREASKVQTNALQAAKELASGVVYNESMPSTWKCPKYILDQGEAAWDAVRKEWHMEIQGTDVPPPLKRFLDMKFPKPVIGALEKRGITKPTPIQMQGLPVALAGRDMVGIAFTGSGKTLAFTLPLIMVALEEELRMPLTRNEGPIGIILAPSRELARQTYDQVQEFCDAVSQTEGYPQLRCQLMIGGESVRDQLQTVQNEGLHCLVATPGRLRDVLKRKAVTLSCCRYICFDEADRMLDMGFDEEVGEIINYFPHQRQTLLFSATFPKK